MSAILARCAFVFLFTSSYVVAATFSAQKAHATLSDCSVTINTHSIDLDSTVDLSFQISNQDVESNQMQWVRIVAPSSNFLINAGDGSAVEFSGFGIGSGSYVDENISVTAGSVAAPSEDWIVLASDDPGGAGAVSCSGDLGVEITDPGSSAAPEISDLVITGVSSSEVTLTWNTDSATTTIVDYGTTSSYGSQEQESTLSTSHSITLTSLSANTSYHYRISSTDDSSNTTTTSDNTFATAVASSSTTTSTTTVVVVATTTTKTVTISDDIKPSVTISTDFSKPFEKPPKVTGKASDNKIISRIEYSYDNGKNWLSADFRKSVKSNVNFEFTPPYLDEDTYKIKVRAIDGSGNIGISNTYSMTIDRLPPNIGSVFFSVGPQPLVADSSGAFYGLEELDHKITLSAVGGPTNIDILSGNKMFSLVKNVDSGLWSGVISFDKSGTYTLYGQAVDGGGNRTKKKIGSLIILEKGRLRSDGEKKLNSKVSVFYLDHQTNRFALWDGSAYGQANPQIADQEGKYGLYLPPGKYYIEVLTPGYQNLKTNIFEVKNSIPINSSFDIKRKIVFFDIRQTEGIVNPLNIEAQSAERIIGRQIEDVEIFEGENVLQMNKLRGRKLVVSVLTSWNPLSFGQMAQLNKTSDNGKFEIIAIFPQESAAKIDVLRQKGNYSFRMLADPDGLLIQPLNILSLPMNLYIGKNGTIENVMYGIINSDEIQKGFLN